MKRIAVINATKISIDAVDTVAKQFPQVQLFHLMDEGMSYLAKQEGRISGRNMARMVTLLQQAETLGVDGILLSCTIFSPYIDLLQSCTDLPLVAADVGVFEKAAAEYRNIGAVVSFAPTMESVAAVVERCRERIRADFTVELKLAEGAFDAMAAGDEATHNRLLYETALSMAEGKEAVILSQMSHIRALPLFQDFPVPVLTSPPVSLQLLCDRIDRQAAGKETEV